MWDTRWAIPPFAAHDPSPLIRGQTDERELPVLDEEVILTDAGG